MPIGSGPRAHLSLLVVAVARKTAGLDDDSEIARGTGPSSRSTPRRLINFSAVKRKLIKYKTPGWSALGKTKHHFLTSPQSHRQSLPLFFVTHFHLRCWPQGSDESLLQLLRSPLPKSPSRYVWREAKALLVVGSLPTTPWFLDAAAPGSSSCFPSPLGWTSHWWTSRCHSRVLTSPVWMRHDRGPIKPITPTDLATRPSAVHPGRSSWPVSGHNVEFLLYTCHNGEQTQWRI